MNLACNISIHKWQLIGWVKGFKTKDIKDNSITRLFFSNIKEHGLIRRCEKCKKTQCFDGSFSPFGPVYSHWADITKQFEIEPL